MKLNVNGIKFNVILNESDINNKIPIVFLHGFTGSANDWLFIFNQLPQNYYPIAIDLIGHGDSDSPEDNSHYTCGAIVYQINSIISQLKIERFVIVGYSMGGRAAISYSVKYPQKIIAAILESTTPGIEDISKKKCRVEHDLLLSDKIKKEGIDWFIDFWLKLPIFNSLKNKFDIDIIKNEKTKNNVTGLSNSLSGFSTGLMNSYWEEIRLLEFPVLLLSGSTDQKFTSINKRMGELFQNAQHKILDGIGHNTHFENPQLFIKFVTEFLKTF